MITIDEVQSIKSQFETDGITPASEETLRAVCDLALSQHEEIERLRAELKNEKNWRKALKPCPQALLDAHEEIERLRIQLEFTDKIKLRLPPDLNDLVNETLERAAQVCESEKVDYVTTKHPEDLAYNRAIEHCADAILALKSGEPK